jgi:spore coat polysaccharide biosynthesis predicted glycosyltransferase SpsG
LLALLAERSSRCAVLDDDRVDETYQAELLRGDAKWLQFNRDPSQPLWAHLVLNHSPESSEVDYSAIRNPHARLLLGPRFAPLRPEFADAACERLRRGPPRVLVTFGGGHDRGGVVAVLRALLPGLPTDVRFVVISGAHNPARLEITQWIESHGRGRVMLHVDPPRVAPLIASCDLAVMAGGGTVFEVNRFGIPMLLIAIADNQVEHSKAWESQGAAKYLGEIGSLKPASLLSATNSAIASLPNARKGNRVPRLVDGQGRVRVAEAMIGAFGL